MDALLGPMALPSGSVLQPPALGSPKPLSGWVGPSTREGGCAARAGPGLGQPLTAFSVSTVRLHDSISEEGFHYLVFDL